MDAALIASAGLLGLVGAPHCAAMCSAPCGALTRRCGGGAAAWAGFAGGRLLGYMAAGAAVAAGVAVFNVLGHLAPSLRPLWAVMHLAAFGLGAWMLFSGALPAWFGRIGLAGIARAGAAPLAASAAGRGARAPGAGWQPMSAPSRAVRAARAASAGSLWVALPCGLLQSALIVAALASTPWHGAAAMAAFAAGSSLGLGALPLWWSLRADARGTRWAVRVSGALLLAGSGWALGHGLWQRVAVLCGLG